MRTGKWILCGLLFLAFISITSSMACECVNGSFPAPIETTQPPSNLTVSVQLDQEGKSVTATFRGGHGQTLLKGIQLELLRPDCSKDTAVLGNIIGESVQLKGSGCGDQVVGTASFRNGKSYVFLNEKMHYINGICSAGYLPFTDPCMAIAASPSLKPDPLDEIPANKSVIIQANADISVIEVQFRGGFGQNMIKQLEVTRIGPDGSKEMKNLGNRIGDEITFTATNNCMDRIAADVSFIDGTRYHFFDTVLHISRYQ